MLLDKKGIAKVLCVSVSTVEKLVREEGMPHLKIGSKSIRFEPEVVLQWIKDRQ